MDSLTVPLVLPEESRFVWLGQFSQRLQPNEINGAAAVYDADTGLTWLLELLDGGRLMTDEEIDAAVIQVGALGYSDWRAPSYVEIESIAALLETPARADSSDGDAMPSEWLDGVHTREEGGHAEEFAAAGALPLEPGFRVRLCRGAGLSHMIQTPEFQVRPVPRTILPPWERPH